MKIVVDIGCVTYSAYPEDESISKLIARFQPDQFYGFDPNSALDAAFIGATQAAHPNVEISLEKKAAWVYDGTVGYDTPPIVMNPLRSVTHPHGRGTVGCFDLARFLRDVWKPDEEIVLKIDAEGAEYTLLPHLSKGGEDALISLLLVEWHDGVYDRPLRCPVEEW